MADEVVELNVGGRLFATSRATLEKIPRLALDKQPRDSKERVFIDRDGEVFYFLLEFLRTGQLRSELPDDMVLALATEAEHFGVQALQTLLKHKRVVVRESLWSHRRELLGPHYNGICSIVLDKAMDIARSSQRSHPANPSVILTVSETACSACRRVAYDEHREGTVGRCVFYYSPVSCHDKTQVHELKNIPNLFGSFVALTLQHDLKSIFGFESEVSVRFKTPCAADCVEGGKWSGQQESPGYIKVTLKNIWGAPTA